MDRRWLPVLFQLLALVSGSQFNTLKVRWGNPYNAYYPLPWSMREAGMGTLWRKAGYDPALNVYLVSHVEDPRFFLLFDKQHTIAGVAFGFDKRDVNRVIQLDPDHNYTFPDSMYHSANIWDKDIWLNPVLFDDPVTIRETGRVNLNQETDDVINGLYYWADSRWRSAPLSECDVTSELTEQGCYKGMGKHYFYKTDSTTPCAQWQGFFVTYNQGRLAGFGVAVFGSFVSTYFTPTYYEFPAFPVVRSILSDGPACMDDWLPYTGITSVHVFLTADNANIICDQQLQCPQPADQSIQPLAEEPPWYRSWRQWLPTSQASLPSQPSYTLIIAFSTTLIFYYFSCSY